MTALQLHAVPPVQPCPGEIKRDGLLRQLQKKPFRLVALAAGVGYGKTTLMAQHAQTRDDPLAWFHLTDQQAPEQVLAQAQKWIQLHLNRPFLLVLDNAHHLTAAAWEEVQALVQNLSEGQQVMVASHETPELPLSRWLSMPDGVVLGHSALAFTAREVHVLLKKSVFPMDQTLLHHLQGWPLAIHALHQKDTDLAKPSQSIQKLLEALPAALLQQLYHLLDSELWSESIQDALGHLLPAGWLHSLLRAGLPCVRSTQGGIHPHPLVFQVLNNMLKQKPELFRMVHTNLARAAERKENWPKAIEHHLISDQPQEAQRVSTQMLRVIHRLPPEMVLAALRLFPVSELSDPQLVALGIALLDTGQIDLAETLSRDLELRPSKDCQAMLVLLTSSKLYRAGQNTHAPDGTLKRVDQGLSKLEPVALEHLQLLLKLKQLKLRLLTDSGQDSLALEEARQMVKVCRMELLYRPLLMAHLEMAHVLISMGQITDAEQIYLQVLERSHEQSNPDVQLNTLYHLGVLYLTSGNSDESMKQVSVALASLPDQSLWMHPLQVLRACILSDLQMHHEILQLQPLPQKQTKQPLHGPFHFFAELLASIAAMKAQQQVLAQQHLEQARNAFHPEDKNHALFIWHLAKSILNPEDHSSLHHAFFAVMQASAWWLVKQGIWARTRFPETHQDKTMPDAALLSTVWDRLAARLTGPNPIPFPTTRWTLQARTLGTFQLFTDSKTIGLSLKRSEELLLYLAIHGPVGRPQLLQELWDEEPTEANDAHLKVLLRKLKQELTLQMNLPFSPVLSHQGKLQLHPSLDIQLDAIKLLKSDKGTRQLLKLYHGDFLPLLDRPWANDFRLQCQDVLISALLNDLKHLSREKATEAVHEALRHIPDDERLLGALKDLGPSD